MRAHLALQWYSSSWQRHYSFTRGLVRLSDGDRVGAKEHFQKVLDTKFYANVGYPYARAYLARLNRDEKWPKWIPDKK